MSIQSDHYRTSFEKTPRADCLFLHVAPSPHQPPDCQREESAFGQELPSLRLLASEIKQTSLSTNLASLSASKQEAAGLPPFRFLVPNVRLLCSHDTASWVSPLSAAHGHGAGLAGMPVRSPRQVAHWP